jgi:hypothetical protein
VTGLGISGDTVNNLPPYTSAVTTSQNNDPATAAGVYAIYEAHNVTVRRRM